MKQESWPLRRAVSVRDDVVVKVQKPRDSRRERLRTLAGGAVGQLTGLFVVPEIVSYDDSSGEIVFERLRMTGLREALSDRDRSVDLVCRAARALAAIHEHMEPSDDAVTANPGGMRISPERSAVPLHGDFGLTNIFYLPATHCIALIDWANADWMEIDADLGPPEIDIAVFLTSLFHRRVFGPWPLSRRHEVARQFLATYASASRRGIDLGILRAIVASTTPRFNQRTRRDKGKLRALAYRHSMVDFDFFLRRLSGQGFAGRRERQTG